jgi:hypothetical protein
MRRILPAILALAYVVSAHAQVEQPPFAPGYWEQGWGLAQFAATYQISLRVDNLDKASASVEKILSADGAPAGSSYGQSPYRPKRPLRSFSYFFDTKKAERVAKRLLGIGVLESYNVQRTNAADAVAAIDERLALLNREMKDNADQLKKMPISSYFLESQKQRLLQSRDSFVASEDRAQISVTLSTPDSNVKK